MTLKQQKDSKNRLGVSNKSNKLDQNNASGFEYGALKGKEKRINHSKYLSDEKYNTGSQKRRWFSQENSWERSMSLSTQRIVFSKQRNDIRNSSLENVHTFHLKQSIDRSSNRTNSIISNEKLRTPRIVSRHNKSSNSEVDIGSPSIYVEERVKLLKNNQYGHVYKSLKELWRQIKEFKAVYLLSTDHQKDYFRENYEIK